MKYQIRRKISDFGVKGFTAVVYKSKSCLKFGNNFERFYYFRHLSVLNTCFNELRYRLFLNMYNMSVQG